MIPILFGSYTKLEQRRIRGQADMIYQNNELFLCLCIELPDGIPIKTKGFLGVDMGIVNLATTSDGETFSGEKVDKVRVKMQTIRGKLQHKGSKSAKRHLKKLSGRERRLKRHTNHTIAKQIVLKAKGTHPSWSPGTKIAFVSNKDGNAEIYVMNTDGTNQTRLTNNSATDSYPFPGRQTERKSPSGRNVMATMKSM